MLPGIHLLRLISFGLGFPKFPETGSEWTYFKLEYLTPRIVKLVVSSVSTIRNSAQSHRSPAHSHANSQRRRIKNGDRVSKPALSTPVQKGAATALFLRRGTPLP